MSWLKNRLGSSKDAKTTYSDEDLEKYTGMTRTQLDKFAANTPGVAGNQKAGDATAAGTYDGGSSTFDISSDLKFPPGWTPTAQADAQSKGHK
jgi:hypothetical protein